MRDYVNDHFHNHPEDLVRPPIVLKDGSRLSVQASSGHYCAPRESWFGQGTGSIQVPFAYDRVEVLCRDVPDWKQWKEEGGSSNSSLYCYIPVEQVNAYIDAIGLDE